VPWYVKLGPGAGAALAVVEATAAAVSREHPWNGRTLKWFGILQGLLLGCGLASYYCHLYLEDDGDDQQDTSTSVGRVIPPVHPFVLVNVRTAGAFERGKL
jgi:hypothetical protein